MLHLRHKILRLYIEHQYFYFVELILDYNNAGGLNGSPALLMDKS